MLQSGRLWRYLAAIPGRRSGGNCSARRPTESSVIHSCTRERPSPSARTQTCSPLGSAHHQPLQAFGSSCPATRFPGGHRTLASSLAVAAGSFTISAQGWAGHRIAAVRGRTVSPPSGEWSGPRGEPPTGWLAAPGFRAGRLASTTTFLLQGAQVTTAMTWTETSRSSDNSAAVLQLSDARQGERPPSRRRGLGRSCSIRGSRSVLARHEPSVHPATPALSCGLLWSAPPFTSPSALSIIRKRKSFAFKFLEGCVGQSFFLAPAPSKPSRQARGPFSVPLPPYIMIL